MALHASWVHGNAVQVERPENFVSVGHYGWGGDAALKPGQGSWFHIPIPTPVITGDLRTTVQRLFVLYLAENCEVRNVHVYDGSAKVQELNNLHLTGEHRTGLDGANTFDLAAPHTVLFGMGITFFVQASIGVDTAITTRFITATAGADFHA
jgi:hypothetical protein